MPDPCDHLSDEELMCRVQAGDGAVFAELVRRYQPALARVAISRLRRCDWAEDAVQEAFLAAFKGRQTYRPPHRFRTWLWTILLNQCRRSWKVRSRRPSIHGWGDEPAEAIEPAVYQASLERGESSPLARLLAQERAGLVDGLLQRLTPVQADAVRLRFFGGLKFDEIAEATGCSLGTAKSRVKWGLLRLAELVRTAEAVPRDLL